MGLFNSILEKLGVKSAQATQAPTAAPVAAMEAEGGVAVAPPPVKAIAMVDVVAQLDRQAAARTEKLNWRTSIVDLLKLLDIDSTLAARKALATELGCPAAMMSDSAQMNTWLHKTVLARIAENGGNVPRELLD